MNDASDGLERFIARWQAAGGSERANFQSFVADLCALLGVSPSDPAREDTRDNAYVFERRITFRHGDGSSSAGFIDCYRRACFVMEGKKVRAGAPRPPFVVVVDVGNVIELYAEFSRIGFRRP
jgi:hypothetical protein